MGENSPSPSSSPNKLSLFWDSFINAESKSYVRGVWLDGFLAEYLILLKEGQNVKEILPASLNVAALVACELLSDVHETCSQLGNEDNLAALKKYLLTGRGWRFLAVLRSLNLQDVSCSKELATLLISLFSVNVEESKVENRARNPYVQDSIISDLSDYVDGLKLPSRRKHVIANVPSSTENVISSPKNRKISSASRRQAKLARESTDTQDKLDTMSTESEAASLATNKSSNLRMRIDPMDFDYFQSYVRSEDDVRKDSASYCPSEVSHTRACKLTPEAVFDDRINDVFQQKINFSEFKILVVDILKQLTMSENLNQNDCSDVTQSISFRTLMFAVEKLCDLQFGSPAGDSQKSATLKAALVRLLLTSLTRFLTISDITLAVMQNGIVHMMKKLLEDAISKCESSQVPSTSRALSEDVDIIFSVLYGLIIVFHRLLLQNNSSLEKLGQFLSILGRFSDSRSGKLVDRTIDVILGPSPCNNETSVERVKQILISVSRLVTALKRTRSKLVHSRLCKRNRHKHCSLWSISYHHDHVFGEVYSQSLISSTFSYNCCVSSLFMSMSKCLNVDNLVVYTLQAMMSCGGCCCFPSSIIVTKLLQLFRNCDAKVRCVAFMFLEKTLYRQMGALRPVEQFLSREGAECCQVCPEKLISLVDSHEAAADSISGRKSCLDTFCDLLLSTDTHLSHAVSSHLLRVVPRCRPEIQKEMLFDIFYPVFLSAKTTYTSERSESSKFLLLTCLSAFTNLLVTVKFMEQFLSMSGLNHIEDLLYEPDFIKPCCAVIEIAILVQVVSWDVSGLESEVLRDNEISMSNLDILLKYVNNSTQLLLQNVLKLEYESTDKESSSKSDSSDKESNSQSSDKESPPKSDSSDSQSSGKKSPKSDSGASIAIRRFLDKFFPDSSCTANMNWFSMTNHTLETATTDSWGRFRCLLEQCMVLWRTCTNICIYSPQMRKYFSRHPISQQSFDLLCMTLDQIGMHTNVGGTKCSEISEKLFSANQDTIKLFESLLILNIIAPTLDANSGTLMTIECVMSALREKLLTALNNGNVSARHLCDVLLRASTLLPSEKIVIPQHKMPKLGDGMSLSDGLNSEPTSNFVVTDFDEAMSSPNSTPELSADEGYEADVDVPENGIVEVSYPISQILQCMGQSPDEENCDPALFSAKLSDSVYCIQRLGSLCQDSDENCLTLSGQNFIAQLMRHFQRFITSANPQYLGIQQAVLAVISHIAQRNIEAPELSQLLQLFTADNPSMDPLLVCLNRIVSNVRSQPQSFVNFPTNCREDEMLPSATSDPAEKMAISLRTSHSASGIESSWSKSAAILPLNQELGWSMWASGLSLSMWFSVSKPTTHHRSSALICDADLNNYSPGAGASSYSRTSRSNAALLTAGLLHLVSIGYETLTLEFWIHPHSDILIVRLNRLDENVQEILVEKKIDLHLTSGVWQHLAINVKDNFQKRKVNLQVTLIFNGCHEVPVELSFVGLLIRKSRCTCLLVGHNNNNSRSNNSSSSSSIQGGWQLGNLLMFRCPVFSKEKATCLMAYGPDHCYLIETEVGNTRPSMASVFSKGPLSANIDWDAILNNQTDMMRELQESLLLVYSARTPQSVCVYPQVVPNNTGVVGSLLASQVGFRVVAVDGRAAQQLPMCLSPAVVAPALRPTLLHSFHLASNSIGGVSLFLFLFARVVELEASEETQARALLLLLRVVNSNAEFYSQFFSQEQDRLLTLVLTSSRCKLGLHILKAILDVVCDRPGLLVHQQGGAGSGGVTGCQFQVSGQSRALLVDGALLSCSVLACWSGWQQSHCLATLLQLLLVLLRDDHPRREFNLAQLNRIGALDSLLTFCKESLEESGSLQDREVCLHIVDLVQSLMSAPPRHDQIESVMRLLVLGHPAHLTYITHLWSSFYFVLAAKRPHILQRPNFVTSARLNILAQSSSDKAEKMKKNRSFLAGKYTSALETNKKTANLAVDPQKLNKALANLQIKEETSNREEEEEEEVWVQEANNYCDSGIAGSFRDYSDLETPLSQPDKVRTASKENRSTVAKSMEADGSCSPASEIVEGDILSHKLPKIDENSLPDQTENVKIFKVSDTPETPVTPDNKDESRAVCEVEGESERASDLVTEGLLQRLHDIILVLPDSNAQIVLERIVKIEALLVMANHPNARIRIAVIKIVTAYLQRATDTELSRFLRLKGFQLLANQLFAHEVTRPLAAAVVTLVTGRHWLPLADQLLADTEPVLVSPLQMAALPALLALLPRAAADSDLGLAAQLVAFVERFFNKVPQAFRALTDAGILEVLLKTLLAVAHSTSNEANHVTDSNQGKVLNAIHSFLIAIVSQTVQGVGNYYIQVMNDLIALFNCLEKQERHDCDDKSRCVYVLRAAHCTLLETALAVIQNKISFQQPLVARIRSSATAFFNNVFQANFEEYVVDSGRYRRGSTSSLSSSPGANSLLSPLAPSGAPDKTRLTHNDLVDRFRTVITKCVEFVTNNVPIDGKYCNLSTLELHFIRRLFSCMMGYIVPVVDRKSVPKTAWNNTMWTARETIRNQTAKLLAWMLSPAHHTKVRMSAVNAIRNEPKAQDIVLFVLDSNQAEENVMLFLWDLVNGQGADTLSDEQRSDCVELCDRMQAWGVRCDMCVSAPRCEEDVALAWERDMLEQKMWWKAQEANAYRCLLKMEGIVKSVSECALSVMKTVTDDQNCERKQLMDRIRTELSERVHTQMVWKTVVRQLTHERAVWYFPKSYPRSWQLDPTEGPARVRIRLQRCHLSIKKKFMKPQFVYKTESLEVPQPLSYLFDSEGRAISSMSAFLIEKLHTDQKIRHMATARVITPALEVPGELLIGESCVYFIPSCKGERSENNSDDENYDLHPQAEDDKTPSNELHCGALDMSAQAWQFEEIKEIHTRRFQLKEQALEIFLLNGRTFLLAFQSPTERDEFQKQLEQCPLPNRVPSDNLLDAVQLWRDGHLTNWEYLMTLNKMAGRTYNDLMQYPVLPFVLAAYHTASLDLADPAVYRNLQKPMAVQNKANEAHYIKHYNYFKQEMPVGSGSTFSGPYHYGSHYSNSGSVLHFLVRLPPFTSMFLQYQDKNFDLPDRTFHCLETTWRLSSRESTTDVKELLPEFFFLPEFLTNIEGFDFGVRQNGERVDNVTLPKWAFQDPRRFILIHRQALESEFVRENLPHWIDLVFGYKQTGRAAVEAVNVFHPATYQGFQVETVDDPLVRTAWQTMVRTYGQTPRQLFKLAHPMCVQSLAPKTQTSPAIQGNVFRQALESEFVRENLPHWIDLVFGYKQTGRAAVEAVNVFHPATYQGFQVEAVDDPLVRTAWQTMVRTYGQTPRQLFKLAHPMCVQSLAPKTQTSPAIQGVAGLQWGSYVGSPTEAAPTAVLHQHHRTPVARLVPLLTNDVFGLAPQTTLLLAYSKEKTLSLVSSGGMCIHGAALMSWGHPEGVLRLKGKKEQAPQPAIRPPATQWDAITQCVSVPDCAQLWIGYSSGRILVYRYRFIVGKNTVEFAQQPEVLVGHSKAILSLALSHEFSVAVSGGQDGSAIIWDMNRTSYVQSLPDISMPIALACVSSTLGDIATVGHSQESTLRLHSINAAFLGSVTTPNRITAVCFSNAHEGVSINVIATGMQDGSVRLWSTWDLSPVCEITSPSLTQPIVSLTYSHDSQHLYASAGGGAGYVVVWQSGNSKAMGSKLPKYLNLTNLIDSRHKCLMLVGQCCRHLMHQWKPNQHLSIIIISSKCLLITF
ncbi:lysosomal-trafficking regulator [Nilaparvata lugens]|uniref:lysosomal-trafficking regulator n=1 Tax=Nilaparvata lugens TaxID=108931 RepID=UPI00193D73AE|nr:lysosomal-trafficking regulator [Nilaparvata lugens]